MGFGDLSMMDGEKIVQILNATVGIEGTNRVNPDMLLLTNRRIIHLETSGGNRKTAFVSLKDIESVEMLSKRQTRAAVIWGAVSFLTALMLWQAWNHPWASALAALALILIGVYLMVDRLRLPDRVHISFKTGSTTLNCNLEANSSNDGNIFVNKLFDLKSQGQEDGGRHRFAPR